MPPPTTNHPAAAASSATPATAEPGMLVLTRRPGEEVHCLLPDGSTIVVTVLESARGKLRVGFKAPKAVKIYRKEILDKRTAAA